MAQHKVGNRYLEDDEYEYHKFEIWGFYLFLVGAFVAGAIVLDYVPDDWSKELRYALVVAAGGSVGAILGYFALYIRMAFYLGLFITAISGVLYWVWTLI